MEEGKVMLQRSLRQEARLWPGVKICLEIDGAWVIQIEALEFLDFGQRWNV